jgi:hypothetical protein
MQYVPPNRWHIYIRCYKLLVTYLPINTHGVATQKTNKVIIIIIIIIIIRGATGSDEPWPAEQLPLAVSPDCTRRYWVDMWSVALQL